MSDQSPTTHEEIHESNYDQYRCIRDISYNLEHLANAFHSTGNTNMANDLHSMSQELEQAQETLRGNSGMESTLRLRETQQATSNMLGAVLASATLKAKEQSDGE